MKEAIRLRIKKADENLAAAQVNINEEFYGVAVNRAYYAIFCAAQALLLIYDIYVKTHKSLHIKFGELFISTNIFSSEMSTMLTATEDLRVEADYDFEHLVTLEEASTSLNNDTTFISEAKKYLRSQNLLDD